MRGYVRDAKRIAMSDAEVYAWCECAGCKESLVPCVSDGLKGELRYCNECWIELDLWM